MRFDSVINCNKKIFFWFRDDDGNQLNDKFIRLIDFFEANNCPILEAVIPANLDPMLVTYTISKKHVYIGQHGFSHTNYSDNIEVKSELCESRDVKSVVNEQMFGNSILEKNFGDKYSHIFVPPFFEITDTIKNELVEKNIYKAFSIWWDNCMINNAIPEVNVQIDFIDWRKEEKFAGDKFIVEQIEREVKKICEKNYMEYGVIGVVLHHNLMCDAGINALNNLIMEIKKCKNTEIIDVFRIA